MKLISISIIVLFMLGCVDAYTEPQSGPTANISISGYNGYDLAVSIYTHSYSCAGEENVPYKPLAKMTTKHPLKIPADKLFTFMVNLSSIFQCPMLVSFYPQANENYLVYYNLSDDNSKCHIKIYNAEDGTKGMLIPVPFYHRTYESSLANLFGANSTVCTDFLSTIS
ncbi:MAG: hypothetical protein KAT71_03485 [Gammaproteobacteria bacterium]|nr:hypothetical protein [Gammaproteobacteria bacterium]